MSDEQVKGPVVYPAPAGRATDGETISTKVQPNSADKKAETQPREIGGRKGPEPTRFGDWEKNGRCIDF